MLGLLHMGSLLGMYKDAPDVLLSLVKTLVKRPSNDQKMTTMRQFCTFLTDVHLGVHIGGTAKFLIYLKKGVFGGTF